MSEWGMEKLGNLISIKGGYSYKGEHIGHGTSLLLGMGCVSFSETFLQSGARLYAGDVPDSFLAKPGDIVLATRQQSDNLPILGAPAIVPDNLKNKKVIVGTNLYRIENKSAVNNQFLFWLLKSVDYKNHIDSCSKGSTVKMITKDAVESYEFLCPSEKERNYISDILWHLTNKIDLLHRQNATLEKMAETLFRQWFVEEAKEEWEMVRISDYAIHFKESIQPQKNKSTLYAHYSIPSYGNGKNPVKELGGEIQSNKYKIPNYCILFSKLNPHKDKRVWLLQDEVESNGICSTEFQVVLPKKRQHLYFLYGWLTLNENYNEIASGVGGTSGSHQRIDPSTIYEFQCPLLTDDAIERYNIQIEPIFKKQVINQSQIRTLTALRDTLLPKLMSGEVRV